MSAALDFRKCKRLLLSSLAVSLASRGSRRGRHDAPHRAKSLFRSIEKQGFVLAFCKAIRVKYFYALQKPSVYAQRFVASNNATHSCDKSHNRWLCPLRSISANASACFSLRLRSAAKNDAPCRFLYALVQIPVVNYRKTKRTSEFACPFCLAEKQGFEPWLRSSRTTPLAGEPLRPLGYFSLNRKRIIKDA